MSRQGVAGYSGKRLADKLGIREGMLVVVVGAPPDYTSLLAPLPRGVTLAARVSSRADVLHVFVKWRSELVERIAQLNRMLRDDAVLWISWPKKSSGHPTDLTEDALREAILPHGLVDVKVCAVDPTWSGLKFVRRLRRRR
jgi:hypothetical protein